MESTLAINPVTASLFLPASQLTDASTTSSAQPATIKMEDLEANPSSTQLTTVSSLSSFDLDGTLANSVSSAASLTPSFPPPGADSKSSKKRKSWGQVLPEPKTNLPPRKRAKTADEKEQRRIERVKRNRLAAHNSRERKRAEVEALQDFTSILEDQLKAAQELVARQAAEIKYYQSMLPEAAKSGNFAAIKTSLDGTLQNPLQSLASMGSSSTATIAAPASILSVSPTIPASSANSSPVSLLQNLDSPATSPQPGTPCNEDEISWEHLNVDQTQHSAVMLWPGLQCQSTLTEAPSSPSSAIQTTLQSKTTLLLTTLLMYINLTFSTSTPSSSPTRQTSTSSSPPQPRQLLQRLLQSQLLHLLLPFQTSSPLSPSQRTTPQSPPTLTRPYLLSLLLSTLRTIVASWTLPLISSLPNCTPAQAQRSLLATSQALLREMTDSSACSKGLFTVGSVVGSDDCEGVEGGKRSDGWGSGDPPLGGGWEERFREILEGKKAAAASC